MLAFILCSSEEQLHQTIFLPSIVQVEFIIGYTSRGELTYANVNIILADVDLDQLLFQTHSVQFQVSFLSQFPAVNGG